MGHRWLHETPVDVTMVPRPSQIPETKGLRGAFREGQKYERQVQAIFEQRFKERWLGSPWFRYRLPRSRRVFFCQPDGYLVSVKARRIVIVEIKVCHTAKTFEQLHGLYLPITKAFWGPRWSISLCEVVRWFRPEISFPGRSKMAPSPDVDSPDTLSIHICNPSREKRLLSVP